jgi:hypothetical protein
MPLPVDFHFSQGSLHDFLACPRRFYLRHVARMAWPAVEAEPYLERELHLKRGALFHHLVEQELKGIPAETLAPLVESSGLGEWWTAFLAFEAGLPPGEKLVETALTTRLGAQTLISKYDLLIRSADDHLHIFDWKTTSIRQKSDYLREDIQTRLYLLMAAEALSGIKPEAIAMTYWFAAFPSQPELIPYSAAQHQRDRADIQESTRLPVRRLRALSSRPMNANAVFASTAPIVSAARVRGSHPRRAMVVQLIMTPNHLISVRQLRWHFDENMG